MQLGAKEFLENELERLQEILNVNEVHRLTRKYKFTLIIEQVSYFKYFNFFIQLPYIFTTMQIYLRSLLFSCIEKKFKQSFDINNISKFLNYSSNF